MRIQTRIAYEWMTSFTLVILLYVNSDPRLYPRQCPFHVHVTLYVSVSVYNRFESDF